MLHSIKKYLVINERFTLSTSVSRYLFDTRLYKIVARRALNAPSGESRRDEPCSLESQRDEPCSLESRRDEPISSKAARNRVPIPFVSLDEACIKCPI